MPEQESRSFQFDLTETLLFHKSEGVSEMLGIGLDPEISIQTFPDYVSVRGIIALTGEYLPDEMDEQSDIDEPEVTGRYFKKVVRDEDGICEFSHHFPVDISIPHERVKRMDELSVSVDSFDYHLPESCKLELEASLVIQGLEHDRVEETKEVEEPEDSDEQVEEADEVEDRITFDLKIKAEEKEAEQSKDGEEDKEDDKVIQLQREDLEGQKTEIETKEEIAPDPEIVPDKAQEMIEEDIRSEPLTEETAPDAEVAEESHSDETVQRPTYLLDLFDQSDSEKEQYTKMTMYIVQEQDSLEGIAEQYGVNTMKLQEANRLESLDVYQGQIIYVPK
ncbi:stage VI sporulation protein D [Amphibacillus cookii]|uniref:stage VI sporulation protein D n=1 Tax=Amphibacillus cookii TaxID=767787 RepID=UPI00195BAEFF|nr:stage VI sporulation protein D [Amphibacillus cookii]MBM7541800.1 stage VI sporulation protein D [Amphibacillus cookii]